MSKDNLRLVDDADIITVEDAQRLGRLSFSNNEANIPRFRKALRIVAQEQLKRGVDLVEFDTGRGRDAVDMESTLMVAFPNPYFPSLAAWIVGEAGASVFNISLPSEERYKTLFQGLLFNGCSYPEMMAVYMKLAGGVDDRDLLKYLIPEDQLTEGTHIAVGQALNTYYEVAGSCLTNKEGGLLITGLGYSDPYVVEVIERAAQEVLSDHPVLSTAPPIFKSSLNPNFSFLDAPRWVGYNQGNRFECFDIPQITGSQVIDLRAFTKERVA